MIKSNSDHVLRVDKAAAKLNHTIVMANSSGNLMIACKRNSLCTCADNENHVNSPLKEKSELDKKLQNCTEHQNDTKKCKLMLENKNLNDQISRDQSNARSNQLNHNDDQAVHNQNNQNNQNNNNQNESNQQQQPPPLNQPHQQNNDQDNNENNEQNELNQIPIPNQMVDINNNIIDELMVVDENNNLVGLPDANFDLNNNYIWNNRNLEPQPDNNQQNEDHNQQQQQENSNEQNQSNQLNEHTSQDNLALLKEKLNCNLDNVKCKSNCTNSNCKSTCTNLQSNLQSVHNGLVQIRQRKKLLELDLNKPRSSNQFYSSMNEEENVIKEEESSTNFNHHFRRSSSSGRRKKSIQCKKCLTKHLAKCDQMSKCDHYHSNNLMDYPPSTPDSVGETTKRTFKKATTPLTLCPITIKEQLITDKSDNELNELLDSDKSASASSVLDKHLDKHLETHLEKNLDKNSDKHLDQDSTNSNATLISPQCPICLFVINEPCKPNSCDTHSFCKICLIEWAKVSNECPLCRKPFSALLNKNNQQLECLINQQNDRDLNFDSLSQSAVESILNLDDLNWPFIASAFLNNASSPDSLPEGQENLTNQQCEQINSILNSFFGHLEPQNMDIQWPF